MDFNKRAKVVQELLELVNFIENEIPSPDMLFFKDIFIRLAKDILQLYTNELDSNSTSETTDVEVSKAIEELDKELNK